MKKLKTVIYQRRDWFSGCLLGSRGIFRKRKFDHFRTLVVGIARNVITLCGSSTHQVQYAWRRVKREVVGRFALKPKFVTHFRNTNVCRWHITCDPNTWPNVRCCASSLNTLPSVISERDPKTTGDNRTGNIVLRSWSPGIACSSDGQHLNLRSSERRLQCTRRIHSDGGVSSRPRNAGKTARARRTVMRCLGPCIVKRVPVKRETTKIAVK